MRVALSSRWERNLAISVQPSNAPESQEIFGALRNWASDAEAPRWQQAWLRWRTIFRFALFWVAAFGIVFLLASGSGVQAERYKDQAHTLLKGGISSANELHAIQLLLAIDSGYEPKPVAPRPETRLWVIYGLGLVTLGALSLCPEVVVGLWGGKRSLERWRTWIRIVTVSVPAAVITGVLLPWLLGWLGLLPGH